MEHPGEGIEIGWNKYRRAYGNQGLWTERPLSKSSNWFGQVGWVKEEPRVVCVASASGGCQTIATYTTGAGAIGSVPFPIVTLYEQQDDGSFVILESESIAISARQVSTVAEVEEILRNEMLFIP